MTRHDERAAPSTADAPAPSTADAPPDRPRIAVVGGKPAVVRKAHDLGLDVVYVQHPNEYDHRHWPYVESALLLDYAAIDDLLPLVRTVHETRPLQAVVSLYELGLLPAARVDDLLGLGGNPTSTVELLLDKARMRRHLNALGISAVAADVGRTAADVQRFGARHGYPMIVKPVREAGSIGIFLVPTARDADGVVDRFHALVDAFDRRDLAGELDEFLMEEFLDGPEISVETLSTAGKHVLVGVTDKLCGGPGFVEVGHSSPSRHAPSVLREVEDVVVRFLDAVGLLHGPAHTEVKLTTRGPRIIESHNRIGGDRINELTELAYGVDMERHALGERLGRVEPLTGSPRPIGGAAVRFFTPPPGRVVAIHGAQDVADHPALVELTISVEPGSTVPPLTWSEDRVGHVLARGADADEAIALCEELLAKVTIQTEAE